MKRYEVLLAKELYPGSDEVRSFGYKAGTAGDNYALFWKTDCFVRCSLCDGIMGNRMAL